MKFIFVDGWALSDANGQPLQNVTAVVYKEEESGYMAGYAAVKKATPNSAERSAAERTLLATDLLTVMHKASQQRQKNSTKKLN